MFLTSCPFLIGGVWWTFWYKYKFKIKNIIPAICASHLYNVSFWNYLLLNFQAIGVVKWFKYVLPRKKSCLLIFKNFQILIDYFNLFHLCL